MQFRGNSNPLAILLLLTAAGVVSAQKPNRLAGTYTGTCLKEKVKGTMTLLLVSQSAGLTAEFSKNRGTFTGSFDSGLSGPFRLRDGRGGEVQGTIDESPQGTWVGSGRAQYYEYGGFARGCFVDWKVEQPKLKR